MMAWSKVTFATGGRNRFAGDMLDAKAAGISASGLPAMTLLTLVGSNAIGNVPTVVLLVTI
jgi:hypothetical protein